LRTAIAITRSHSDVRLLCFFSESLYIGAHMGL